MSAAAEGALLLLPEKLEQGSDEVLFLLQSAFAQRLPASSSVRFCESNICFFAQRTAWSCSYASLQMIISSLLPIFPLFDGESLVPNVASLQTQLVHAWRLGFDREGGEFFNYNPAQQRIGVSDIAALLRSKQVPTRIVDFRNATFAQVERFCYEYFFADKTSSNCRFPLILGNADHTIVVVGCQVDKINGAETRMNLIVFDPAMRSQDALRCARDSSLLHKFYAKRTRHTEFQIAMFEQSDRVLESSPLLARLLVGLSPQQALAEFITTTPCNN